MGSGYGVTPEWSRDTEEGRNHVSKLGVVQEGLIFNLDAGATDSYAGSGGTWSDLSGNGRNASIINASFGTKGNVPAFVMDSTNEYFNVSFNGYTLTEDATLEAWIYPDESEVSGGDRGTIMVGGIYLSWNKSNQKISSYWYGKSPAGYHEPSAGVSRGQWHHFIAIWDYSNSKFYQYVDGELVKDITVTGTGNGVSSLRLAMEGTNRQFAGGFGALRVYSIPLTPSQVRRNFNSMRQRYGV